MDISDSLKTIQLTRYYRSYVCSLPLSAQLQAVIHYKVVLAALANNKFVDYKEW